MLENQHRMRNSISNIMRLPRLYPTLKDSDHVNNFPDIRGMRDNFYFIDHKYQESYVSLSFFSL